MPMMILILILVTSFIMKKNIVELAENSKINFKNTNILIDKGIIDYNKNEFEVFGNFYLYEDLTILSGQNLKGNTNLTFFSANDVSYIYNDDLKIDSDNLNRENNLIYFYNNFLTPCELDGYFDCPTWSLRIDKTEYNVEEDKFTHFDTFLQIADYKVFYLPYFSHYGSKAPRKKGFLTPSIEFTLGGDQAIILPYYFPINDSTDALFKPKISFDQNFEFIEKFHLRTNIENIKAGGATSISIDNIKNENNENINTSIDISTKQVIDKEKIVSASGVFTNSISTTRSINEEPITFEDLYLRFENYNFLIKDDYLKTELSSVEAFDSTNISLIPISPSINYLNNYKNNFSLINDLDFTILKRDESTLDNPSEGFRLNLSSELFNNYFYKDYFIFNKLLFNNSINEYYFNNDESLNHETLKSFMTISSDLYYNSKYSIKPRVKFIFPTQLINSNKNINEDSESITFNYQNHFSENRFFGNDLYDNSPRIVYGIENFIDFNNQNIELKINQVYEANNNGTYANLIKQSTKFSDYAIEAKYIYDDISIQLDSRLDQKNLSKKEMSYSLNLNDPVNLSIYYNETSIDAFKNLSNDTQSLGLSTSKKINDNMILAYDISMDVKNNYDPYKSSLNISLFDECSQLDIAYSNTRFNDNYNTKPSEIISLTFSMDYLGFFGYQQTTDLFFSEAGSIDYGL